MTNKTKKPLFASGLYIALSLCILAVVVFGAYSTIANLYRDQPQGSAQTQKPLSDLNLPTVKPNQDKTDLPIISPDTPEKENEVQTTPEQNDADLSVNTETEARVFSAPVKSEKITKEFKVEELVYSTTMNDYRAHSGLDIAAEPGAPVCALTDGVVESIHPDPLMGQTVVLDHGNGLKSIYQNLALEIPEGIVAGVEVEAGTLIGAVGESAIIECAEESHLHFEVMQDGSPINPKEYLN